MRCCRVVCALLPPCPRAIPSLDAISLSVWTANPGQLTQMTRANNQNPLKQIMGIHKRPIRRRVEESETPLAISVSSAGKLMLRSNILNDAAAAGEESWEHGSEGVTIWSSWSFSSGIASTISTSSTGHPTTRWVWVLHAFSQQLALPPIWPNRVRGASYWQSAAEMLRWKKMKKAAGCNWLLHNVYELSSNVNPGWS